VLHARLRVLPQSKTLDGKVARVFLLSGGPKG